MKDLWQDHYQILLKILLTEQIRPNANTNTMIKNRETCGIKYKDSDCFLEHPNFENDLIEFKCKLSKEV